MNNNLVMDSPESLAAALCSLIPNMKWGFTIKTEQGEIQIQPWDAEPFATAMESLLLSKIHRIQQENYDRILRAQITENERKQQELNDKWSEVEELIAIYQQKKTDANL